MVYSSFPSLNNLHLERTFRLLLPNKDLKLLVEFHVVPGQIVRLNSEGLDCHSCGLLGLPCSSSVRTSGLPLLWTLVCHLGTLFWMQFNRPTQDRFVVGMSEIAGQLSSVPVQACL